MDEKLENHMEITVPSIIAVEIHKMLGENPPAARKGPGGKLTKGAKNPRKRCHTCNAVVRKQKDGTYKCKTHGEVTPKG